MVALVGVYSTEAHPFGLIYEYLDGLDLKQYLRNEPHVGGLKLVHIPYHVFHINHLTLWTTADRYSSGSEPHA